MAKISRLVRSTRIRVAGAAVGAVLVALLVVGVSPQQQDALGQTVPVQDIVDVDFDFDEETNCLSIVITIDLPGDEDEPQVQEFSFCFPRFRFGGF